MAIPYSWLCFYLLRIYSPPPSPLFTKLFFCTPKINQVFHIFCLTTIRFSNCLKHDWLCISVHWCYNSLMYRLITTDSGTSMKQGVKIFPQHAWILCLADVIHVRGLERLQTTWSDMLARWSTTSHYSKKTCLGDQGPHHTHYCARLLHWVSVQLGTIKGFLIKPCIGV